MQALGITNDAISSVGVPDGMKITLYEHNNFAGASISLTKHTPILSAVSFNDKASSIKVEKL
ncbi:Development-specific protein S [compost metagenome]